MSRADRRLGLRTGTDRRRNLVAGTDGRRDFMAGTDRRCHLGAGTRRGAGGARPGTLRTPGPPGGSAGRGGRRQVTGAGPRRTGHRACRRGRRDGWPGTGGWRRLGCLPAPGFRAEFTALPLGGTQVVDPAQFLAADRLLRLRVGPAASPAASPGLGVPPLVGAVLRPIRTTRSHW
ncbi:hypothetical protein CA850_18525 [Micromonospora echinospora]|nr:hypothetical protein CA850_18525 [Micromonospora echinospora]